MHCGVRDFPRRGLPPLAARQRRGRDRPPVHFDPGLHGLPSWSPDQPACGIPGPFIHLCRRPEGCGHAGLRRGCLFIIAFLINATSTATSAVFSPMSLLLAGLACLALHLAGVGTKWSVPRRRTRR